MQPVTQNVMLVISDDKQEQKTASGIIIPDSAKKNKTLQRLLQ